MSHIRSLDGFRGIAVLLVVSFHVGLFQAGWIGVQIFFVLSGFLITSMLLVERARPFGEYLGRFYWRRSLRIFPLYFFFLALAAVAYWTLGIPESFGGDWPWLITYTANLARWRDTDLGPTFVHLWSLAVEEQFYLIWPFAVYLLSPGAFRKLVVSLLIFCPLFRLALYVFFQGTSIDWLGRTIYGFPLSQFDAFAAGAAVALWPISNPGRKFIAATIITAVCGAAVIAHQHLAYLAARKWSFGYAMYLMEDGGFVWGYTLLNLTSAIAIAYFVRNGSSVLEHPALTRIGVISYGVYVYHIPLLIMLQMTGLPYLLLLPIYLVTVYVAASISYSNLERPFLALKEKEVSWVSLAIR
jgi:peptidoglycan/LPS O-acetylase OafA/YrhL